MIEGTGWTRSFWAWRWSFFGVLQLRFREAVLQRTARTYGRWNDAFPRFTQFFGIRMWSQEPVTRTGPHHHGGRVRLGRTRPRCVGHRVGVGVDGAVAGPSRHPELSAAWYGTCHSAAGVHTTYQ